MRTRGLFLSVALTVFLTPGLLRAQTAADADFDGSGTVDFSDFLEFAGAFGSDEAKNDLDGNGEVDFGDFLISAELAGPESMTVPVVLAPALISWTRKLRDLTSMRPGWMVMLKPATD